VTGSAGSKRHLTAAGARAASVGDYTTFRRSPVTLDVTVITVDANPRNNLPTVGFDATTTLKRSDFGLGKYVPQVSDEIRLHIISKAVEAKAYSEYLKAAAAKDAAKK
jgi:YceI-like domain